MLEIIVVVGIVVVAAITVGRSFYRTITGRNSGCDYSCNCLNCAGKDFRKTRQGEDGINDDL